LIAEGVGTFLLVLTIISVVIGAVLQHPIAGAPYGFLAVAIGADLVLTTLVAGVAPTLYEEKGFSGPLPKDGGDHQGGSRQLAPLHHE
jgi:hypothetical protein